MPFRIPNSTDAFDPNQAEPDRVDIDILVAGMAGRGVMTGCAVTALGSAGLAVRVAVGVACIAGSLITVAGDDINLDPAESSPRFDLIVAQADGSVAAISGTADADPVFPTLPDDVAALAAVYVLAAETEITDDHVVDKRVVLPTISNLQNNGLRIADTNGSHQLTIRPGSDLTGARELQLLTGDADRTVTLSGNPTLADWFDQGVKQADSPQFVGLTLTGALSVEGNTTLGNASGDAVTINASTLSIPNNLNIDSNSLYIDSTNNIVVVGAAAFEATGANARLQVLGANSLVSANADNSTSPRQLLIKSRGAAAGTPTAINSGDGLGAVDFFGYAGSTGAYVNAARILGTNIGSVSDATNGVGADLNFQTRAAGAALAQVLRIAHDGNLKTGTGAPVASGSGNQLDVDADTLRVRTARTPASATATGNRGEICTDTNFIYVCTSTNSWKRAAIAAW